MGVVSKSKYQGLVELKAFHHHALKESNNLNGHEGFAGYVLASAVSVVVHEVHKTGHILSLSLV